jgi:hypothetical protein
MGNTHRFLITPRVRKEQTFRIPGIPTIFLWPSIELEDVMERYVQHFRFFDSPVTQRIIETSGVGGLGKVGEIGPSGASGMMRAQPDSRSLPSIVTISPPTRPTTLNRLD